MREITLTQADDWHLHLRDGEGLQAVVKHSADQFARAIIMPNLTPPVTTVEAALAYRERILKALPTGSPFEPLMTLYLTDKTSPDDIKRAAENPYVHAVKWYPAGATTNSDAGVTDVENVIPALKAMSELGLPLLVHGEVTDPQIDIFDRENVFIETILKPVQKRLPELRLVLEHITTSDGIRFVEQSGDNVAGTLTAHHLLLNRNAMLVGGIRPHYYCLPVLKREQHRQALLKAATSGSPKFFLGTDSAPHPQNRKESACGCAGMYTAPIAMELYAEAFEQADALDKLEAFTSFHGPDFYRLPRNTKKIRLQKETWTMPEKYPFGEESVIPFRASETVSWKLVSE